MLSMSLYSSQQQINLVQVAWYKLIKEGQDDKVPS